ncbi:hypothetical protein NAP1_15053 [Erythrobacter sp. NAP1]|uniref:hypothetical protein n=1 Tax=Erythrobacter sp. NAP1 TaxID=237727 RepID=UPI0000687691|nr:hypothetical protein [Erythrobacter sp. NAP1]EAQ28928.1 hypothetical protein NAP1_15053 [Erythrobacter sp. NAP1]
MTLPLLAAIAAPLALQAAPAPDAAKPATLEDLPVTEATAPRCGVAFATLEGWQKSGDPRGSEWPTMTETGGREFFVVAMVRLMDTYALNREDVTRLVQSEVARHEADGGEAVKAMLPACLTLLDATNNRTN